MKKACKSFFAVAAKNTNNLDKNKPKRYLTFFPILQIINKI